MLAGRGMPRKAAEITSDLRLHVIVRQAAPFARYVKGSLQPAEGEAILEGVDRRPAGRVFGAREHGVRRREEQPGEYRAGLVPVQPPAGPGHQAVAVVLRHAQEWLDPDAWIGPAQPPDIARQAGLYNCAAQRGLDAPFGGEVDDDDGVRGRDGLEGDPGHEVTAIIAPAGHDKAIPHPRPGQGYRARETVALGMADEEGVRQTLAVHHARQAAGRRAASDHGGDGECQAGCPGHHLGHRVPEDYSGQDGRAQEHEAWHAFRHAFSEIGKDGHISPRSSRGRALPTDGPTSTALPRYQQAWAKTCWSERRTGACRSRTQLDGEGKRRFTGP